MNAIPDDTTIRQSLESQARATPNRVYLRFEESEFTVLAFDRRVNRLANALAELGLRPGDRVAVMLRNHPDHVATFLAGAKLGLVQVPVNVHLRGASLEYLLAHAAPRAAIADFSFADVLVPALTRVRCDIVLWREGLGVVPGAAGHRFEDALAAGAEAAPPFAPRSQDTLAICYTSGTTGPPKGVTVTDKMCRAAASGAATAADFQPGDVQFLWAPLFHIGGIQTLIAAVQNDITLALAERFSASRFWHQVRKYRATKIHYVGGVVGILLKQPPRDDDAQSGAKIAWGGGAPANLWRPFMDRFQLRIHEIYGMTECSSISHVNREGLVGSVGKVLPYFEARILGEDARPLAFGEIGEIALRERVPGLITKEYFRDPEASARALRDGWLHTGDLGSVDGDGFFRYLGRRKDSIRRRGENVSAWEVERVLQTHPSVEECAVIGVDAEIGDQDILAFVKPVAGQAPEPLDLIRHCESALAYFQIPRYLAFVAEFPKTPTHRIRKDALPRTLDGCWDLDRSGYTLRRSER